jgi:hypothetical protein
MLSCSAISCAVCMQTDALACACIQLCWLVSRKHCRKSLQSWKCPAVHPNFWIGGSVRTASMFCACVDLCVSCACRSPQYMVKNHWWDDGSAPNWLWVASDSFPWGDWEIFGAVVPCPITVFACPLPCARFGCALWCVKMQACSWGCSKWVHSNCMCSDWVCPNYSCTQLGESQLGVSQLGVSQFPNCCWVLSNWVYSKFSLCP